MRTHDMSIDSQIEEVELSIEQARGGVVTMKAMEEAAKTDPLIAERVRVFRYRDQEELYDLEKDPDCINNLIDNPEYKSQLEQKRQQLSKYMKNSNDPMFEAFQKRNNPEQLKDVLIKVYGEPKPKKKITKKEQAKDNKPVKIREISINY